MARCCVAHSYTQLYYHVVLVTKYRTEWVRASIEEGVWAVIRNECESLGGKVYAIGGVDDHIHIVLSIPPSIALSLFIGRVKGASSYKLKSMFAILREFRWQNGHYVNTVSFRALNTVVRYVKRQREHHGT
ncbi:MAG: IS200/IS605 family transposase [Candidatus Kapabacteria bacterium]|nr:IS200/IS605 family transposase [Candidatus Kapabacteria bacterium]